MSPKRLLLSVETAITLPFFVITWFVVAVWCAIKAGSGMAHLDETEKHEVLDAMFPPPPVAQAAGTVILPTPVTDESVHVDEARDAADQNAH